MARMPAEAARAWGGELLAKAGSDEAKMVRLAYEQAYGRAPVPRR